MRDTPNRGTRSFRKCKERRGRQEAQSVPRLSQHGVVLHERTPLPKIWEGMVGTVAFGSGGVGGRAPGLPRSLSKPAGPGILVCTGPAPFFRGLESLRCDCFLLERSVVSLKRGGGMSPLQFWDLEKKRDLQKGALPRTWHVGFPASSLPPETGLCEGLWLRTASAQRPRPTAHVPSPAGRGWLRTAGDSQVEPRVSCPMSRGLRGRDKVL